MIILFSAMQILAQTETHQGETMTVVSGPAVFPSDTSLIYWSWGTVIFYSSLSGDVKVTVRAKEDYAGDQHALFIVRCAGLVDTLEINTTDFSNYVIYDDVSASDYELSFINDFPNERNVHLDYVKIEINQIPDTGKVVISWNRNTEPDLAGYKVYWGTKSREYSNVVDVGLDTFKVITGLKFFTNYFFAITAYDTIPNESDFSQEVSIILSPPPDTTYYLLGDYNKDGIVDFLDMVAFDRAWGCTIESPNFNTYFDFNNDGIIDFSDMRIFDQNFGKTNKGAIYVKN